MDKIVGIGNALVDVLVLMDDDKCWRTCIYRKEACN